MTVVVAALIGIRLRTMDWAVSYGGALGPHEGLTLELCAYLAWFALALIFVSNSYGLYGPLQNRGGLHELRMTFQACFTAGLLLAGSLYFTREDAISRMVVVLTVLTTTVLLTLRRTIWRLMVYSRFERGLETRNVLVVGSGRIGHALRSHIETMRHLGYTFKGFVRMPGTEDEVQSGDVLGDVADLIQLARAHFIDEIFLSTPCERGLVKRVVAEASEAGVDVRVIPDLYDGLAWNAPVEYVGQFPTIPLHREQIPVVGLVAKRTVDMFLSGLALLLLSPILLGIAIAVRLDSKGPILYRSERIGKKGRTFCCLKFRTMVRDADRRKSDLAHMNERDGILFKITNDPRITRVGRFLRKYSLDELPQFWNVLTGDMSIVGPRPPIASEVKQYELSHLRRLDVTPGITGLWQVQARQDPSFDSYISLDTAYVENWTFWLDLKIIVRTIGVVFGGTGS